MGDKVNIYKLLMRDFTPEYSTPVLLHEDEDEETVFLWSPVSPELGFIVYMKEDYRIKVVNVNTTVLIIADHTDLTGALAIRDSYVTTMNSQGFSFEDTSGTLHDQYGYNTGASSSYDNRILDVIVEDLNITKALYITYRWDSVVM